MHRHARSIATIALASVALATVAGPATVAQTLLVSPDVPTTLGSAAGDETVLGGEVAAATLSGTLGSRTAFPGDPAVVALHREIDGSWLLAFEVPFTHAGATYLPGDIVRFDGAAYSTAVSAAALGLPPGVGVDALAVPPGGSGLLLSFDAPVELGGAMREPADIVLRDAGAYATVFDASAVPDLAAHGADTIGVAPVPGAPGVWTLAFDVPVYPGLGAGSGLPAIVPGMLGTWDGATLTAGPAIAGWSIASLVDALAYPPPTTGVGATLRLGRTTGAVQLAWQPDCSAGALDYAVYRGTLGIWNDHAPETCTTDGAPAWSGGEPDGDAYYLVVPTNTWTEGSYGRSSDGLERPPSPSACLDARETGRCSAG